MPLSPHIPDVEKCCGCIPDLRTAVTIIAVLGIVTSPAVSWAVVRHAYMVRVSCIITASASRPDVVDINLKNVLSFGFGSNAGIGPSCLSPPTVNVNGTKVYADDNAMVRTVKYMGWVALFFDVLFLMSSIYLLIYMYRGETRRPIKIFMIAVTVSILMSFIYAMLYVSACFQIGGSFPVFEFIFAFVDIGIWIYFLIVVRTYRNLNAPYGTTGISRVIQRMSTSPGLPSALTTPSIPRMTFHTHQTN